MLPTELAVSESMSDMLLSISVLLGLKDFGIYPNNMQSDFSNKLVTDADFFALLKILKLVLVLFMVGEIAGLVCLAYHN